MKAEPSSDTNSRSPRVVSKRRMPTRGLPPGETRSHTAIATSSARMVAKKAAVGQVQAIQEKVIGALLRKRLRRPSSALRAPSPRKRGEGEAAASRPVRLSPLAGRGCRQAGEGRRDG